MTSEGNYMEKCHVSVPVSSGTVLWGDQMNLSVTSLVSSAPGKSVGEKAKLAVLRALRTFIQGVAAALPAGGAGAEILSVGYWEMFGVSVLVAGFTALASLLQNLATFLPEDPVNPPPAG